MTDAPDDLLDVRRDVGRGLRIMADRADGYRIALEMYDGTHAEVHANPAIAARLKASAEAHPISFAHIPVDALLDRVVLNALTSADAAAAARLAELWPAIEDDADDWMLKAGIFGDYYVLIDATAERADGTIDPADLRFVGASPLSTVVVYDAATERKPQYAVKRWYESTSNTGDQGVWRAQVMYDDATVFLRAQGGKGSAPTPERWQYDENDDGEAVVPHVGGRMLVVHLAVDGKPYGVPLHRKAYGAQDAITKLSASNLATTDAQAFPARYALLDGSAEVDDDDDDDWSGKAPSAPNTTPDQRPSRQRNEPGTIALLRGIKSAGTFEGADGAIFYKGLDWYVRAMSLTTGTPIWEFDLSGGGEVPSGESRRRGEVRINRHAGAVIRRVGAALELLGTTALGVTGIDGAPVSATFAPVETATDAEGIELIGKKVSAGVPLRAALLEAGYLEADVNEWWPENQPAVPPVVLTAVATALQQLGAAKALGVITDAEVAALLPDVLTGARGEGAARLAAVQPIAVDSPDEPDAPLIEA